MLGDLPTDFDIAVRTPDPMVVKLQPSNELIVVFVLVVIVAAAWVKNR
ncbi:hypothetical protein [Shewanella sp. Scap07]|nr:hypothetical protein [Shewanella sp. Scap07]